MKSTIGWIQHCILSTHCQCDVTIANHGSTNKIFFLSLFIMQPLVPIETSKSSETLGQGDWLALERIEFIDKQGTKRNWERCIRRKSHSNKVDGKMMFMIMTITTYIYQPAVDIHAIILTPEPELLLVIQYR